MLSLLALGSSVVWGTSDFFGGLMAKRLPAVAVVGITQSLAFVVLCIAVLVQFSLGNPPEWGSWVVWAVVAGISGTTGLVAFYTALAGGTMGVVAPIASMGVIVTVSLGVLSGESPSRWTWVGIIVAIFGIVLASGPEISGAVSPRPVVLAGVAALAFGLGLFSIDRGSRESLLMTLWGMRLTSVTIFAVAALALRSVGGARRAHLLPLAAIGCADLLANVLFGTASSRGQVSVAAVLGSLYPVATILLARVVLKERLRRIQQVGVVLALTGAVLISL
ncbi:DMT family transporter [Knoellia subterranea]|uniref:Membrane protein n=1 Tax=Knoellia subterranea KCTC 19937 TaxID=1385521 RepID=A0A0A0JN61_9MICO|nr:DMT family transporter [Knoellia subterranea]KGN38558.1 membrane protein [Knoellia subterranea KCTC 19937]